MTKISNDIVYITDTNISEADFVIGTDGNTLKKQTKTFLMGALRKFMLAGLSPIDGGNLRLTEIKYDGDDYANASEVLNDLYPVFDVLQYHIVAVTVNGKVSILKSQDLTVGQGYPEVTESDFIIFPNGKYDANSLSVEPNQSIYKETVLEETVPTFKFKGVGVENTGPIPELGEPEIGVSILSLKPISETDVIIQGKKLTTQNLNIVVSEDGKTIDISNPINPSDIKFYVNENYTGGGSDGSLAKPFVTLASAYEAFIGNSITDPHTIINPKYGGIGTIELLSNVTVEASGAKAMGSLSVNYLKVNGNGFKLTYRGNTPYFISTKYLFEQVTVDPITGYLPVGISMTFKDLVITSETQHEIAYSIGYRSPLNPITSQNSISLNMPGCEFHDNAFLVDVASYRTTGEELFGDIVYVQNSLATNKYMIVNENCNWVGESSLDLSNTKMIGTSSTILYNKNASLSIDTTQIYFSSNYVNSSVLPADPPVSGTVYPPKTNIYTILNEHSGSEGRSQSYVRIEGYREFGTDKTSGGSVIGGVDCLIRATGPTYTEIYGGYFYGEKMNNLVQIGSLDSSMSLINFDCSALTTVDTIYGALKYTGSLPASQKEIGVSGSTINNIKNWVDNQYIKPIAATATINGADYTSNYGFPDNATAISPGGLVPGNTYYNTTISSLSKVV